MDLETLALLSQIVCNLALPAIIGWGVWKLAKAEERKVAGHAHPETDR